MKLPNYNENITKKDLRSLQKFFCLFRKQWIPYIIATLVVASRNFVITYINAMIGSKAIETVAYRTSVLQPMAYIAILVVCFAVFDAAGVYFQTTVIHKISVVLREKMFSCALTASVPNIDRFGRREELLSRMNFDIDTAMGLLSNGLLSPIMCCISGVGATVVVFRENWGIGVAIYALGLFVFWAQAFLSKLLRRYATAIQEERAALLSVSLQTFQSSAGIKMTGMSGYVSAMHQSGIRRYMGLFAGKGRIGGTYGVTTGAMQLACFFGVFCYGMFGAGMALDRVVFVSQMTPLIATMILSFSGFLANVQRSMVGIDRILELLEIPVEEDSGDEFVVRQEEKGLETEDLICRYGDCEVRIADINVLPEDGNMVALKGPSGCGKTTLLRLLLKLYPCAEGAFRFFGQDISGCSPRSVRDSIAYVPQENVVFPGTVRENVLLGNPRNDVTDEEVRNVFRQVGAMDWTERIGLDSPLKENGGNLSGGQRQMIAIARALLYRKPILVLDEAFASVDGEHIERILGLLSAMADHMYVIIVTHVSRVMQKCDKVVDLRMER